MITGSTIPNKVESLEDALNRNYDANFEYNKMYDTENGIDWDYVKESSDKVFNDGAKWKAEQLQPLVDSRNELIQQLENQHSFLLGWYASPSIKHTETQLQELRTELTAMVSAIEKAKQIKQ